MNTFTFTEGSLTLNDEQAAIVRQPPQQSLRILASAGSGKTTTVTARIAHLLTDARAKSSQIILLTFTHNAADVMTQRLSALVGSRILCGTFHALSQQILRAENPAALTDLYHVDELPLKALDFLESPRGRIWVTGLRWLFIDEFQDINDVQYRFIRALHHAGSTITIVGDDAQNIYSWRGSCVDYILNFHQRFADIADFQLSTNYRSTVSIVAVANSIMRYIPTLDHKELMTAAAGSDQGERPAVHFFARTSEERDWVCSSAATAATTGTTVILSKFNSVLYAYEAALIKLGVRTRFVHGVEESAKNTVFLSTFHGSKGLEWDNVFIVRLSDEVFPQQKDEDGILQERRLFYVAVTRARRTLTLTYSKNSRSLSRFVREIHRPLLQWRGLPHYELSTLSSQIAPVSFQDWVSILTGEDYRTIKNLGLLPAGIDPTEGTQPTWVTPYWWMEQGMATEFYDFLRAFWFREVATRRPESGAQWDRDAHRCIWTVKIAAEDAVFFEAHRALIEGLAERFFGATEPGTAPPHVYYGEIVGAIAMATRDTLLDHADIIRIIQIIHKMRTVLYNLRFAAPSLSDFTFAAVRHAPPQESRCQLIEAWRTYTGPTSDLRSTYLIGLCRAIADGRSGVLMNLPGEREWARLRPFLAQLRAAAAAAVTTPKTVICRDHADMLVGDVAWFFVPGEQQSELYRLDRILVALLTVHVLQQRHTVRSVCLYQLVTGFRLEWSIATWTKGALLSAFIQARSLYQSA